MNRKPILLVEDNSGDEELALLAFQVNKVPNPVVVARDGQEAIDYLFDQGKELPAFILLDLKIPKINGLEVLKRVRADARTKLIPVIVLTSSTHDADLRASYGLGGNSYLIKSIGFDKFTREIGALANYWLQVNTSPPTGVE